jgi:hypothetical protein
MHPQGSEGTLVMRRREMEWHHLSFLQLSQVNCPGRQNNDKIAVRQGCSLEISMKL